MTGKKIIEIFMGSFMHILHENKVKKILMQSLTDGENTSVFL